MEILNIEGESLVSTNKETIHIPEGVTHIEDGAFSHKINIRKIIMPKTLKSIGKYAFANCYDLVEVIFNEGIEQVGEAAFKNCTEMWMILMKNITCGSIPERCFEGCSNLSSVMFEGFHSIRRRSSAYCTKLEDIYLPKKLKFIGDEAFFRCCNLKIN